MELRRILQIAAVSAPLLGGAALAEAQKVVMPRFVPESRCGTGSARGGDELVVCGRRIDNDSPYRIPRGLRDAPMPEREASHAQLMKDMVELSRYGDQTVGPSGAYQHSRQVDCEWRAERQEIQGKRPDCSRKVQFVP